ncbi:MAG TPA: hypothetical protein VG500_10370 [Gemmatimonadales bacterium]|jgi:hypothetical protein|nr:hypothetical protein [Gemmatimonadales bacterium]
MSGIGLESGTALLALGAVHGLNPGMGWLFAVALGLQERRRGALWGALPPLAAGHAGAIAIAVALAALLGRALPLDGLRWVVGLLLIGLGVLRLLRHRHPRGGMRVGPIGLATWSLLMATGHGAGLMVLPLVLAGPESAMHHGAHAGQEGMVVSTVLHSAGYLAATMLAAVVVYERLGVGVLRRVWVNVDLVWAVALVGTGGLTLVL